MKQKDHSFIQKPLIHGKARYFSPRGRAVVDATLSTGKSIEVEVIGDLLPGEEASISLWKKRKYFMLQGRVYQRLSDDRGERIPPLCEHFGICGGCSWQHISYQRQLQEKEHLVQRAFAPFFSPKQNSEKKNSSPIHPEMRPIIPSVTTTEYRNKMQYTFSQDSSGRQFLGLIEGGSRGKVISLHSCVLTTSWFMDTLDSVRRWWKKHDAIPAYSLRNNRGTLHTLTLREGKQTGECLILLQVELEKERGRNCLQENILQDFIAFCREGNREKKDLSIYLQVVHRKKRSPTRSQCYWLSGLKSIHEKLFLQNKQNTTQLIQKKSEPLLFRLGATSFFQPNSLQAGRLFSTICQIAGLSGEEIAYDLYCGTGTIALSIARYARQVIAIEENAEAIHCARENALLQKQSQVSFFVGKVEEIIEKKEEHALPHADVVFVDPPRAGLGKAGVRSILNLNPQRLIYVSCNPFSQSTDALLLREEGGYHVRIIQPVDQFPHTAHVENIVLLTRADESDQ